jgi:hypothetical protein
MRFELLQCIGLHSVVFGVFLDTWPGKSLESCAFSEVDAEYL